MKRLFWVIVPVLGLAGPASAETTIKGTLAAKGRCFNNVSSVGFQAKINDDKSVSGWWNMGGTEVAFQATAGADGFEGTRYGRTGEIQSISAKKSGDAFDVVIKGGDCTMTGQAKP